MHVGLKTGKYGSDVVKDPGLAIVATTYCAQSIQSLYFGITPISPMRAR